MMFSNQIIKATLRLMRSASALPLLKPLTEQLRRFRDVTDVGLNHFQSCGYPPKQSVLRFR
jgi:hypothetical protein